VASAVARGEGGVVMISQQRKGTQAARERLRSNALLLQSILLYRRLEKSPGFGWGIERAIVDRELSELEEDIRLNPACGACAAVGIMRNVGPDSSQGRTR
jgi:hypothetical protein